LFRPAGLRDEVASTLQARPAAGALSGAACAGCHATEAALWQATGCGFVGLSVDDPVWVPTVFSKNRDRLLEGEIAADFMTAVLNLSWVKELPRDSYHPYLANGGILELAQEMAAHDEAL
jgi:hypothetical protein